ncbi:tetratricopeptide repeat protein [Polaribacter porphyrae]|uniref:Uncharacterized protein n=1 Tax=Polaribacter porphyrae TaxID=1137780 RepID=A0A2S7WR82_9FLAO|nr:tetratricopeptide repeat protein [Polaribacter porphyrae]PQJ80123.1 hypothetical protein BTO18_13475 [Polaribacter porphyrae]
MLQFFKLNKFVLLIFLLLTSSFHAQNEIDSLKSLLPKSKGIQKIDVLNSLASYLLTVKPNESKELLNQSSILSKSLQYPKGDVNRMLVYATYYSKKNKLHKTDSLLKMAIKISEKNNFQKELANIQLAYGVMKLREGRYAEAIEIHFEGLSYAKKLDNKDLIINHIQNIGLIKQRMGELKEANKYFIEALQIAKQNKLAYRSGQIYLNLGVLEYKKNNLGLSIDFNKKAYNILQSTGDLTETARALNNLGFAYNLIGKSDKAISYYNKSLKLRMISGDSLGQARVLLNQSKIFKKKNQLQEAIGLANQSIEILKNLDNLIILKDAYTLVYKLYEEVKLYDKALISYRNYVAIKDTLNFRANVNKIKELTSKYEFSELKKRNQLNRQKLKKRNQDLIIALLILILITFVFLINRYQFKKKLKISQNELKKALNNDTADSKKNMNEIIENLKNVIIDKKDWLSFIFYFDILYPNFFKNLSNNYKDLNFTINEQRLISLIKIKLTTKEIASILSISPASVLKSKTRLKDKLDFDSIKTMDKFIRNL